MRFQRYVFIWAGLAVLVVLSAAVEATHGGAHFGLSNAKVCIGFLQLLVLTLLPAEAITTAISERLGLSAGGGN